MVGTFRPRRLLRVALLGAFAFGLAACNGAYPNSTFNHTTEYNTAIDNLWDTLLLLGTIVFVLTEAGLIYTIYRFRRRPGAGTPKQVHGNTTLEIAWTAIPAVILIFIAIPTVRTIFKTQAKAAPNSLQVEVIGHQWWWEFRYPQYGIVTANELYLPTGRTVNFSLKTADVLHSFWIPQLGGKRDLISNRTNFVWFHAECRFAGISVQRSVCRVLRKFACEHEVPHLCGCACRVRAVGGTPEDGADVPGSRRRLLARRCQSPYQMWRAVIRQRGRICPIRRHNRLSWCRWLILPDRQCGRSPEIGWRRISLTRFPIRRYRWDWTLTSRCWGRVTRRVDSSFFSGEVASVAMPLGECWARSPPSARI